MCGANRAWLTHWETRKNKAQDNGSACGEQSVLREKCCVILWGWKNDGCLKEPETESFFFFLFFPALIERALFCSFKKHSGNVGTVMCMWAVLYLCSVGSAETGVFTVGLNDLKGLFQPLWFCGSAILWFCVLPYSNLFCSKITVEEMLSPEEWDGSSGCPWLCSLLLREVRQSGENYLAFFSQSSGTWTTSCLVL